MTIAVFMIEYCGNQAMTRRTRVRGPEREGEGASPLAGAALEAASEPAREDRDASSPLADG